MSLSIYPLESTPSHHTAASVYLLNGHIRIPGHKQSVPEQRQRLNLILWSIRCRTQLHPVQSKLKPKRQKTGWYKHTLPRAQIIAV